jgi:hypothetical protein
MSNEDIYMVTRKSNAKYKYEVYSNDTIKIVEYLGNYCKSDYDYKEFEGLLALLEMVYFSLKKL